MFTALKSVEHKNRDFYFVRRLYVLPSLIYTRREKNSVNLFLNSSFFRWHMLTIFIYVLTKIFFLTTGHDWKFSNSCHASHCKINIKAHIAYEWVAWLARLSVATDDLRSLYDALDPSTAFTPTSKLNLYLKLVSFGVWDTYTIAWLRQPSPLHRCPVCKLIDLNQCHSKLS